MAGRKGDGAKYCLLIIMTVKILLHAFLSFFLSSTFFFLLHSWVSSLLFLFLHPFSSSVLFLILSFTLPSNLPFPHLPGFPFLPPILPFSPVFPIALLIFLPLPLLLHLCPLFPSSYPLLPFPFPSRPSPIPLPFVTRGRSANHLPGCYGIPLARIYLAGMPACARGLFFAVSVPR